MKVLIISPRFPYRHGKADSMTVFHLIQFLAAHGHQVILATFNNYEKFATEAEQQYMQSLTEEMQVLDLIKWKKWLRLGVSVFTETPFQVSHYKVNSMQTIVDELIEKHQPDVLYAHLIRSAEYIKNVEHIPKILAMQVAQTLNYRRLIRHERKKTRKLFYQLEHQRVIRYEAKISQQFERVLLISPNDSQAIKTQWTRDNIFYSPHGIDVDFYAENLGLERQPNVIAMNGDFGTPTNIDGALYFYEEIFPAVRKAVPTAQLWLVGRNPAPEIKQLEKDSAVTVTGRVKDIRPYLQQATVGVAPIRAAAGLQNKILVSLAASLPMVVTQAANEGLRIPNGEVLLEAADTQQFAAQVIELLTNVTKQATLSKNSLKYVKQYWTWDYHFKKLEEMMLELVADTKSDIHNYYPFQHNQEGNAAVPSLGIPTN